MAESPIEVVPAAVTVRGLAPELKTRLRVRAAHNARSMEAEARAILEAVLSASEEDQTDLATFARALFAPLGGVELKLPPREAAREPPDLGERGAAHAQPSTAGPATPEPALAEPAKPRARAQGVKPRRRKATAPTGGGNPR